MTQLEPGAVFGRDFRVVRPLRAGGMGSVYVVEQLSTGAQRALKVMAPELASDVLQRGITLTGGGAKIRRMADLITFETGLPVHLDPEPLTCVVRGTGLILDDLARWRAVLAV